MRARMRTGQCGEDLREEGNSVTQSLCAIDTFIVLSPLQSSLSNRRVNNRME